MARYKTEEAKINNQQYKKEWEKTHAKKYHLYFNLEENEKIISVCDSVNLAPSKAIKAITLWFCENIENLGEEKIKDILSHVKK